MVTINIQKKHLWFLSTIIVLSIAIGFTFAYTTDGSGGPASTMGHSAEELEGVCLSDGTNCPNFISDFGAWTTTDEGQVGGTGVTLIQNTVYQTTTAGIVIARTSAAGTSVRGFTDSTSSANVERTSNAYPNAGSLHSSITMPVKQGDYWKVTGSTQIFWIPFQ